MLLNSGTAPNRKLATDSFTLQYFIPDTSLTSGEFPNISQTAVKFRVFPDKQSPFIERQTTKGIYETVRTHSTMENEIKITPLPWL